MVLAVIDTPLVAAESGAAHGRQLRQLRRQSASALRQLGPLQELAAEAATLSAARLRHRISEVIAVLHRHVLAVSWARAASFDKALELTAGGSASRRVLDRERTHLYQLTAQLGYFGSLDSDRAALRRLLVVVHAMATRHIRRGEAYYRRYVTVSVELAAEPAAVLSFGPVREIPGTTVLSA